MIIDIHNHPYWEGYGLDRFIANMDQYGIDVTWIFGWECPKTEYDSFFKPEKMLPNGASMPYIISKSFHDAAPDRFVLGYAPDFRVPGSLDKLKYAVRHENVRVLAEVKLRTCYDQPDAIRMFRYCGENGIPVILDYNYPIPTGRQRPRPDWWYGGGINDLERVLRKCPDTCILGHDAGFWAHISNDDLFDKQVIPKGPVVRGGRIEYLLETYPNLYCDTSGPGTSALMRDPEYAKELLTTYQDRMLFGRDYVDNRLHPFIMTLDLEQAVLDKYLYQNALKLVPLKGGEGR